MYPSKYFLPGAKIAKLHICVGCSPDQIMSYHPAHIVAAPNEFRLPWHSHVNISDVKFGPEGAKNLIAVSGWDGSVHVFNTSNSNDISAKCFYFHGRPVLNCAFAGPHRVASGGLCRSLKLADIESGKDISLGQHDQPIRCIRYSDTSDLIISGSWDHSVRAWDPRVHSGAVQVALCSDRIFAMDCHRDQIVVGTRDRKVFLYDVRNMANPVQVRESPLKYQTRAVAFFPDREAFIISSIEGRVAVEYIRQDPEDQKKKYAFKCHRMKDAEGVECIYPVNAIAFHPVHQSFATGGSDAFVNVWDPFNRKRLVQLHKFDTSIIGLDFNCDGSQLAIASSYAFETEPDPSPLPPNTVTVRSLSDQDVRVKSTN